MTSIHIFDSLLEDGNLWIKGVMEALDTDDPHLALTALRAGLHALRDRIPVENAVHLGAQLPILIRGLYYENWHMTGDPSRERHLAPFVEHVERNIPAKVRLDPMRAAEAAFAVLSDRIDHKEVAKVVALLPLELRDLWPYLDQIDAAQR